MSDDMDDLDEDIMPGTLQCKSSSESISQSVGVSKRTPKHSKTLLGKSKNQSTWEFGPFMLQLSEFDLVALLVMAVVRVTHVYDWMSVVVCLYNVYHVNSHNCLVLLHTIPVECLLLIIIFGYESCFFLLETLKKNILLNESKLLCWPICSDFVLVCFLNLFSLLLIKQLLSTETCSKQSVLYLNCLGSIWDKKYTEVAHVYVYVIFIVKTKSKTPTSFCWPKWVVAMLSSDYTLSLGLLTAGESCTGEFLCGHNSEYILILININCTPCLTPVFPQHLSGIWLPLLSHWPNCRWHTAVGTASQWPVVRQFRLSAHVEISWLAIYSCPCSVLSLTSLCSPLNFKATQCCNTFTNMLQMDTTETKKLFHAAFIKTPLTLPP